MTESALLASLGVASKAARPLGRGPGEGAPKKLGHGPGFKWWVVDLYP